MVSKEEMLNALEKRHTKPLQDALLQSEVVICGLGGLGSNIAISLARVGVGKLRLIDFDRVDISNLNRQQYFAEDIGRLKTEALKEKIAQFAPFVEVEIFSEKITEENVEKLLANAQYVCEAFDVAEQKAMLVNNVLEKLPNAYLVASSGMAGFGKSNEIKTRKITTHFYMCGDEKTKISSEVSLMSARVMLCAAHQANLIISLIAQNNNLIKKEDIL